MGLNDLEKIEFAIFYERHKQKVEIHLLISGQNVTLTWMFKSQTDSTHWIWKLRLKYPLNNWSKDTILQKNAKYTHVFIIFSIFLICNIKYYQDLHNLWRTFNEFTKDLRHTDLFVIVVLNEWIEGIGSLNLWLGRRRSWSG